MRVVNIRTTRNYTQYIGRPGVLSNPASHLASKFEVVRVRTREEAIEYFRSYALRTPKVLEAISQLKESDVLGCFCKPLSCHGDVIVEIWKQLKEQTMKQEKQTEKQVEKQPEKQQEKQPIRVAELPLISVLDSKRMKQAKALLEEIEQLKAKTEILTDRLDEAKEELGKIQTDAKLPGLRFGRLAFYQQEVKGRESLKKELLIEQGVTAAQIKAATVTGKPSVRRTFEVIEAQ